MWGRRLRSVKALKKVSGLIAKEIEGVSCWNQDLT